MQRQYLGCAGRVANGINVVYASYAALAGHAVIEARLYVPNGWADDRERCRAAGIPNDLEFKTKPRLAAEIVKKLLAEGRCPPWVTGDEVYGRDAGLQSALKDQRTGYVLKIPCSFRVTLPAGKKMRADHAARLVPANGPRTRERAATDGRAGAVTLTVHPVPCPAAPSSRPAPRHLAP